MNSLKVTSGVPQGSELGPVVMIYINDLVSSLERTSLVFADDAKNFKEIRSDEDIQAMKRDLLRIQKWSKQRLLEFNADKCVMMHVGHRNPEVKYQLNEKELEAIEVEKDLGVFVSKAFKPGHHIGTIVNKANRWLV